MADAPSDSGHPVSPRDIANKSDREHLLSAIRMSLDLQSAACRSHTQTFNRQRYRAVAVVPDYDALKDQTRKIKEDSIARLPDLLKTLAATIRARGGHLHIADTGEEATKHVLELCKHHDARLVVKGKSITTEEIHLNHILEAAGIEVAETDLGEFIIQLADEQPSHVIAPALHYSRERITELFKKHFKTELPLDTGEALTQFARERLREKFLQADVGITGANLIAADTGTLMLVESEGNIRMCSLLPPVHIAIAGVEKVIVSRRDMAPFLELLARSATGQSLSSYTSFLNPPLDEPSFALTGKERKRREFHLILIDNGRMRMRDDPVLREALYCIRCSACLNSCANFQTVGGHAFGGESYSGGIGGSWEAGTGKLEDANFSELCTGCSRCVNQCPVRIDIPWLNENLRERLNKKKPASMMGGVLERITSAAEHDRHGSASKIFFGNYHWFAKWGTRFSSFSNAMARSKFARASMERWFGVDRRRTLPLFPKRTLVEAAASRIDPGTDPKAGNAVLFPDVYTNFGLPQRGLAALKVLRALGVDIVVSESVPEGRAALSQGMIATATLHARQAAATLSRYLDEGRDVIVVEPSAHAMFLRDFRHLLADRKEFERLRDCAFEPVQYVAKVIEKSGRSPRDIFDVFRSPVGTRLFVHFHCQQRTNGCAEQTESLLRAVGFDVATSAVECCGMAGSFGYKKDFFELSMAVGEDLFAQVRESEREGGSRALIASGISCTEQLQQGMNRSVLHPVELLAATLKA
jgi:iron-sulfur cluster protein